MPIARPGAFPHRPAAILSTSVRFLRADPARYSRPAALAVNGLLAAGIVWTLAQTALLYWPSDPDSRTTDSARQPPSVAAAGDRGRGSGDIAQWHLFGQPPPQTPVQVPVSAPETQLELSLRGTLASQNPQRARAIIATPKGDEDHYAVGDTLPGGAEIRAIHPDRVVLMREGQYETLKLPRERRASAGGDTRSAGRAGAASALSALSGGGGSAPGGGATQSWTALQQRFKVDVEQIASNVKAMPVYEQGQQVGFRLRPGNNAELLQRFGLRSSDVITSVNGVAVTDRAKLGRALMNAVNAGSADVTVRRNGRQQTLSVDLGG